MAFVLAFAIDSDALIRTAFWTGITAIVLTVLLVGIVIVLRLAGIRQQRQRRKIIRRWRPVLMAAIGKPERKQAGTTADPAPTVAERIPSLPRADRLFFLEYWNQVYDTASDEGRAKLVDLLRKLGLEPVVQKLAESDYLWRQLLGLQTLGRIGTGVERLIHYTKSEDNVVSLTAARALIQADPKRAVPVIMPLIRSRKDWAEPRVAEMLIEAGDTGTPLAALFDGATPEQQVRLIRYAGATRSPEALAAVRRYLQRWEKDRDHTIVYPGLIAGIEALRDPEDHALVVSYLSHPDWRVREAAATSLGRIAAAGDEKRLGVLLHDEHWWVRYRAAQAIAYVPNVTIEELRKRTEQEQDPAAADVLRHVLAERQMA
jgi:HEAT repeat protein